MLSGAADPARAADELYRRLVSTQPGRQRRKLMTSFLVGQVAEIAGLAPTDIDETRPFAELGLTSQSIAELAERLRVATGAELSATAGWRYPSIAALGDHVAELMGVQLDRATESVGQK
ncbi:acyl carrier protein [Micromonospora sp. CP22]|uniref:acyl carrier protein n=2 Tax=unclassified Micromonospora TaxID=2617518 RepID=UPI0018AD130D|nr:acyl carrier protein [Micromonospora sp. CP22]